MDDADLIQLVLAGEKNAYAKIIDKYEAKLSRYVRKFIWNNDDVADVLQNIFTKSYMYLGSYDRRQSFNSWIYRIAHNEAINFLKKHRRFTLVSLYQMVEFDTLIPLLTSPEKADDRALYREHKAFVDSHLQQLDLKYREVLVLYFYEDMSYEEIAEILRIPKATVGVRLNRAKAKLKVLFEAHEVTPLELLAFD